MPARRVACPPCFLDRDFHGGVARLAQRNHLPYIILSPRPSSILPPPSCIFHYSIIPLFLLHFRVPFQSSIPHLPSSIILFFRVPLFSRYFSALSLGFIITSLLHQPIPLHLRIEMASLNIERFGSF